MSAAYIPTAHVRHLSVFSQPLRNTYAWAPLCGLRSLPAGDLVWFADLDPELLAPVMRRRYDAAMRRPVCKRCASALASLNDLNTRSTP